MGDMRTIEQQRQSYVEKTAYLLNLYGDEVSPYDFYRSIFPEGWLQERGTFRDGKYTAIANAIHIRKRDGGIYRKNHHIFDDLAGIAKLKNHEVFLAPCSFIGGKKDLEHLRYLHGFAIDLDYVDVPQLSNLTHQIDIGQIPRPTYLVNSGTGLHLYYVFDQPIKVMPDKKQQEGLKTLKFAIIEQAWTDYTSRAGDQKQHQGISQQYRIIGSRCKSALGKEYEVLAWKVGGTTTIETLLNFKPSLGLGLYRQYADQAYQLLYYREIAKQDPKHVTLEQAKEKWPEWYQKRIVEGQPPIPLERRGKWHVNRRVYDWWFRTIAKDAKVGHRYLCLFCLAVYAIKCDIPKEEFERDALSLYDQFEAMTDDETNHFDYERDMLPVLNVYNNKSYATLPIGSIQYFSNIKIERNRRNYRKQDLHLKGARAIQEINDPEGSWRNKNGRPIGSKNKRNQKKELVAEWRAAHPNGKKIDCERETGVSRHTVLKWWDTAGEDLHAEEED